MTVVNRMAVWNMKVRLAGQVNLIMKRMNIVRVGKGANG